MAEPRDVTTLQPIVDEQTKRAGMAAAEAQAKDMPKINKTTGNLPGMFEGAKFGVGEALLNDPIYGPELRYIEYVREVLEDEGLANDLWLKSKWGQLDADAQRNYLLKLEKGDIYEERLRTFLIRIKKSLAAKNLLVSDADLQKYFDEGKDDATIIDDAINSMSLDTKDKVDGNVIIQGEPGAALEALRETARANGFNFDEDFADQKNDWLQRILRGEDVENFKRLIRNNAKLGLPDNVKGMLDEGLNLADIYAPYRKTMATLLELSPDAIKLDDPVLQSAFSGDKEMSLYDFKRAIRKDPRWQYTDNAREDVSTSVLGVLRDFGFQG